MGELKTRPFFLHFFKFTLLISLLYIPSLWSVEALIINKSDYLELVISSKSIKETGSWMFFMSNDLETGKGHTLAGIKNVDYKIEGGRLARYSKAYEKKWHDLGKCEVLTQGNFQISLIPKSILIKPNGKIDWRLVIFPHDKKEPVFIPEKLSTLELKNPLRVGPAQQNSVHLAYFLDNTEKEAFVSFKSGSINKLVFKNPQSAIPQISFDNLRDPSPNSLWLLPLKSSLTQNLSENANALLTINELTKSLVFDRILKASSEQKKLINSARFKSAHHSGRKAFFLVEEMGDIPQYADGLLMTWRGPFQKKFKCLDVARKVYSGPIFSFIGSKFYDMSEKKQALAIKAFLRYHVFPILEPDQNLSALKHDEVLMYFWLWIHNKHAVENELVYQVFKPFSKRVQDETLTKLRRYAFSAYLKKCWKMLNEDFVKEVQ